MDNPPPRLFLLPRALLKIFFNLLYRQFSWTYDNVATIVSLGRWNDWVRSTLPDLPGPRVLEIGHGPGHLLLALHQAGLRPVGLDASPWMSCKALRRLQKIGFQPLLVNGYAQFTSFATASFDQVVSTFPAEFIYDPLTITEINRILVPNGYFLILWSAQLSGRSILERSYGQLFHSEYLGEHINNLLVQPLNQEGFHVTLKDIYVKGSHLLMIKAVKMASVATLLS